MEVSGIEGADWEYWSPTPYFKATGSYLGGTLKCFAENWEYAESKVGKEMYEQKKQEFLLDFANTIKEDMSGRMAARSH